MNVSPTECCSSRYLESLRMPGANSKVGRIGERTKVEPWKSFRPTTETRIGLVFTSKQFFWRLFLYNCVLQNEATTRRATTTGSTLYRFVVFVGDQQDRLHPWDKGSDGVNERVPVLCYCRSQDVDTVRPKRSRLAWSALDSS